MRDITLLFLEIYTTKILSKEVAKMRRGLSHYLETNPIVCGLSDIVRQIIFTRCPQNTTTQPPLLIILVSLHCLYDINYLSFPKK